MKYLATTLLLWLPFSCFTQQWDAINENHESVSFIEFTPKTYFGSNQSLYFVTESGFNELNFNLEVTDGTLLNDSCALLTIGSGSYSDGIYKINFNTGSTEVMEYFYKPQVIKQHNDKYYCGFWGGIAQSEDGVSWSQILTIQTDSIISDILFDDNKIMAIGNCHNASFIFRSEDNGPFEFITPLLLPYHAASYDLINHKLYVGVYNMSDSDGLYVSNDYGTSFELVRYMDSINALYVINENKIAIGVANHTTDYNGVYLYNTDNNQLVNISGNLFNKNINNITVNPLVNCVNIVVSTPEGAYISCDFLVDNQTVKPIKQLFEIYPNPANSAVNISFKSDETAIYELEIINIIGRLLHRESFKVFIGETKIWDLQLVNELNPGMYIFHIEKYGKTICNQKLIKY